MVRTASIFSQILSLVDRLQFANAAKRNKSNRYTKKFTAWDHFVTMIFCQLAQAKSLRETCDGLKSAVGKARHLGIRNLAGHSTLAYANEHRDCAVYKDLFFLLAATLPSQCGLGKKKKFRFKNKLLSLDSSVITLCLSLFPWADYTRTKGGVKLHMLLDHDGYWPSYAYISEANCADVNIARSLALSKGSIVAMDRAYVDYELFGRWILEGVYFVTRLKAGLKYEIVEENKIPESKKNVILQDRIIRFSSARGRKLCPYRMRLVSVWDSENERILELLTNNENFSADTISQIYQDRWEIELFFKALKQNLKVKTFLGTSRNALEIQLWTALIALMLVKYLQWQSKRGWSLSNLVALLRWNLFQYKKLWEWMEDPLDTPPGPPDHQQCWLPGFNFGQPPQAVNATE